MANALNKFFHSVFNPREEKSTMPYVTSTPSKDILSDIKLTEYQVIELLRQLDPNKACGPDCIPSRLLLELADVIAPKIIGHYSLLITHYSLLVTHYSEYKHPLIFTLHRSLKKSKIHSMEIAYGS